MFLFVIFQAWFLSTVYFFGHPKTRVHRPSLNLSIQHEGWELKSSRPDSAVELILGEEWEFPWTIMDYHLLI